MVIKNNSEVVVCYGHIHSNAPKGYVNGTYHVGMDTNNLTPVITTEFSKFVPTEKSSPYFASR